MTRRHHLVAILCAALIPMACTEGTQTARDLPADGARGGEGRGGAGKSDVGGRAGGEGRGGGAQGAGGGAAATGDPAPRGGEGRGGGQGEGSGSRDKAGADGKAAGKGGGGRRGRGGPMPVRVATASLEMTPRTITVVAPLVGRRQAGVYSKVTGRIASLGPSEGTKVRAGEILFRVDRADPGESFLSTPVASPIAGWIGRWMVTNVGEHVTPTTPVVTVVDDSHLRATVYLSTEEWVGLDDKAVVTVTVDGATRQGKVVSIARAADWTSGRGSLVVEVPNENHGWRVGMVARVRVDLDPRQRMLVPSAALNITDQGAYVFAIEGDKAKRVPVQYRLIDNDTVELLSGVPGGTSVVIAGGNLLTDGATVTIIPSVTGEAS